MVEPEAGPSRPKGKVCSKHVEIWYSVLKTGRLPSLPIQVREENLVWPARVCVAGPGCMAEKLQLVFIQQIGVLD